MSACEIRSGDPEGGHYATQEVTKSEPGVDSHIEADHHLRRSARETGGPAGYIPQGNTIHT